MVNARGFQKAYLNLNYYICRKTDRLCRFRVIFLITLLLQSGFFERNYVAAATFDIYDFNGRCIGLDR